MEVGTHREYKRNAIEAFSTEGSLFFLSNGSDESAKFVTLLSITVARIGKLA